MSYAERLRQMVENSPQKEIFNHNKKAYDWSQESKQKRPLR